MPHSSASTLRISLSPFFLDARACQFVIYFDFRCTDEPTKDGMIKRRCPLSPKPLLSSLLWVKCLRATHRASRFLRQSPIFLRKWQNGSRVKISHEKPTMSRGHEQKQRLWCLFRHWTVGLDASHFLAILPNQTNFKRETERPSWWSRLRFPLEISVASSENWFWC